MDMWTFIFGAVIGAAGGILLKEKLMSSTNNSSQKERELYGMENLTSENEKLRRDNLSLRNDLKEEREKNQQMSKELFDKDDKWDDLNDEIKKLKSICRELRDENATLTQQNNDWESLYTARKQELESLQEKYDEIIKKQ